MFTLSMWLGQYGPYGYGALRGLDQSVFKHSLSGGPADGCWLDPMTFSKALIARLGYTVYSRDIKVLNEHWSNMHHSPLPTVRRLLPRERSGILTDSVKLYWATESSGLSENSASVEKLVLDGSLQTLSLTIASRDERLTALRLDVSGRPGCFDLEDMFIVQENGGVLWRWQHSREQLLGVQGAALVLDPEAKRSCVLSRSNDPQFFLDLPQLILEAPSGGLSQIQISAWPQRL